MVAMVPVRVEPLHPAAWEPFGQIPVDETAAHDPVVVEFLWNDPHVNFIGQSADELARDVEGRPLCDHLNRHDTHTQLLMPMNRDGVIVVAPADVPLDDVGQCGAIRAFRVRRYECVNLARGTWHWGPMPIGPGRIQLLNLQGRRYAQDNTVAHLARDLGVVVVVDGLETASA